MAYVLHCEIAGIDLASSGREADGWRAGVAARRLLCGTEYRTVAMRLAALRPLVASMIGDDDATQENCEYSLTCLHQ